MKKKQEVKMQKKALYEERNRTYKREKENRKLKEQIRECEKKRVESAEGEGEGRKHG